MKQLAALYVFGALIYLASVFYGMYRLEVFLAVQRLRKIKSSIEETANYLLMAQNLRVLKCLH